MSETNRTSYKYLFELRILHHYWLDEGNTIFDLIDEPAKKEQRLLNYDVRTFLKVGPTTSTLKLLRGLKGIYKNTALGCLVGVPADVVISRDEIFEFVVTVKDAMFFNYTALTLRPQKIVEAYHAGEKKLYRYKTNVPFFSNLKGSTRGQGQKKLLFLSRELPEHFKTDDQIESISKKNSVLSQLTSEQPSANIQELSSQAGKLPVFMHQGDIEDIEPPVGLNGIPKNGINLTDGIPDNVFALIQLSAKWEQGSAFNLVNKKGKLNTNHPLFQIHFKNRSTTWKYMNAVTGAVEPPIDVTPRPLTYFGNAGTKQKPSEGLVKIVKSNSKVTQLISEIYIPKVSST